MPDQSGVRNLAVDRPCRLCGAASARAFVVADRNRRLGPGLFEYRLCSACASIFIAEPPADLARYYPTDGYGSADERLSPELERREQAKLDLLLRFLSPGRIVEIGPGPGLFTRVAKDNGFQVTAIEMDGNYCRQLEEVIGVTAIQSDAPSDVLSTLPPSDAVVMWHALEHLADPWAVLDSSAANLRVGGVLALSTPNPQSLQFRLLRSRWVHVDAPRHLQLIPFNTLERGLRERGLHVLAATTTDPVGKELNLMGWERALRGGSSRAPTRLSRLGGIGLTVAARAIERRGLAGSAYTALFRRGELDSSDESVVQ
jgi:SAM-dependent methyltransferase